MTGRSEKKGRRGGRPSSSRLFKGRGKKEKRTVPLMGD